MTRGAKRILIAEACGYEERGGGPEGIYYTHDDLDGEFLFKDLPNYFHCLNAIHEAEKVLTDNQKGEYINQLSRICGDTMWFIHATASQRAEAFGRTLGLWT